MTYVFLLSAILWHGCKVLGGVYASNTSGITAQHLEWVSTLLVHSLTDLLAYNLLLYANHDGHGLTVFSHFRYIKQHSKFFRKWPSSIVIRVH